MQVLALNVIVTLSFTKGSYTFFISLIFLYYVAVFYKPFVALWQALVLSRFVTKDLY